MLKIIKQYWGWSWQGICYAVGVSAIVVSIGALCGCGHNVYLERETTGLGFDIPFGDANLGFVVGCNKIVRATVRGGASFETSSSNGGGLFSGEGGQSKITQFKSHAQLNEGNLVDVLTSPDCPPEAKVIIASNLAYGVNAPYFPGSILQTKESTIHIGRAAIQSNDVEQFQTTDPQGINKLIDSTQKVIGENVVNNTVNSVKEIVGTNVVNHTIDQPGRIVHDVVNPLEDTVESVDKTVNDIGEVVRSVVQGLLWIILAIAGLLIVSFLSNKCKKKRKSCHIEVDKNPEAAEADAMTTAECEQALDAEFTDKSPKTTKLITETVEEPKTQGPGWFKRFCDGVVKYTKVLIGWIKLIPPEYRKQIMNMIIDYCKQKKAERDQAKLEAEKQKKSKKKK